MSEAEAVKRPCVQTQRDHYIATRAILQSAHQELARALGLTTMPKPHIQEIVDKALREIDTARITVESLIYETG